MHLLSKLTSKGVYFGVIASTGLIQPGYAVSLMLNSHQRSPRLPPRGWRSK